MPRPLEMSLGIYAALQPVLYKGQRCQIEASPTGKGGERGGKRGGAQQRVERETHGVAVTVTVDSA